MSNSKNRLHKQTTPQEASLYEFVEQTFANGYDAYDYAKSVWIGNPHPAERRAGQHPWPEREYDGETFVYSVPIHAGFSAVRGTALFIGKDPWRDEQDPRSWLVAEADLQTGREHDHAVLSSKVDDARHLWLQLAPENFDNIPRWNDRYNPENGWLESPAGRAYNPAPRDQIRIEGRLTPDYYLETAELRNGQRSIYQFEEIEVLESMLRLIQAVDRTQNPEEQHELREIARKYEQGRRAVALSGVR